MSVNACLAHLEEVIFQPYKPNILVEGFLRIRSQERCSQKTSSKSAWTVKQRMTFTDHILKPNFWEDIATIALTLYTNGPNSAALRHCQNTWQWLKDCHGNLDSNQGALASDEGRDWDFNELQWEYNHVIKGMSKYTYSSFLQKLTSIKWGLIRNRKGLIFNIQEPPALWRHTFCGCGNQPQ